MAEPGGGSWRLWYRGLLLAALLVFIHPANGGIARRFVLPDGDFAVRSPRLFDPLGLQQGDSLLVWGWMPEWYVWSGAAPAVRESVSYNQITPGPLQEYYWKEFLADVEAGRPAFVVDAVNGASFGFHDPAKFGLAAFPRLGSLARSRYRRVGGSHANGTCPVFYARNDRADAIARGQVRFARVTASASLDAIHSAANVDDYSVTEDTCQDFWLLPTGALGHLDVGFEAPARVDSVSLLNTGGGHFVTRGTQRVRLSLLRQGREVFSRELHLERFPYWTRLTLPAAVDADGLRVDILGFEGLGGGLNEIKVTAASPEAR